MKPSGRSSSPAHIRQTELKQRAVSKLPPPAHSGGGKLASRPQSADPFQSLGVMNLSRPNSRSPGPSVSPVSISSDTPVYPHISPASILQATGLPSLINVSNVPVFQAAGLVCHPNIPVGGQALPFPFSYPFDSGHPQIGMQSFVSTVPVSHMNKSVNVDSYDGLSMNIPDVNDRSLPITQALIMSAIINHRSNPQRTLLTKDDSNLSQLKNFVDSNMMAGQNLNLPNVISLRNNMDNKATTNSTIPASGTKNSSSANKTPFSMSLSQMPHGCVPSNIQGSSSGTALAQLLQQPLYNSSSSANNVSDGLGKQVQLPRYYTTTDIANNKFASASASNVIVNDRLLVAGSNMVQKNPAVQNGKAEFHAQQLSLSHMQPEGELKVKPTAPYSNISFNMQSSLPVLQLNTQATVSIEKLPVVTCRQKDNNEPPVSQGGPLVSQGGPPISQGGPSVNQGGLPVNQGGLPVSNVEVKMRHPPIPKKRIFLPSPEPVSADAEATGNVVVKNDEPKQLTNPTSLQTNHVEPVEQKLLPVKNPFNMRVVNLNNFISSSNHRTTGRSQTQSIAILRAKAGAITNTAKSLDLLRQLLQKFINQEIDCIIRKYLQDFFKPGIENIKINQGESTVDDDHVQAICCQILEEAKKMYSMTAREKVSNDTNLSPAEGSRARKLSENQFVRANKLSLFHIRKRKCSSDFDIAKKKKKLKNNPTGSVPCVSGRSTPSKTVKNDLPAKDFSQWKPENLTVNTEFVIGSRANRALGLGQTRGRLYIKHPELFKYLGDQEDKQWMCERHYMPATGGKSYILRVDDIKALAETPEYKNSPALELDALIGFTVPEWMLVKMRALMKVTCSSTTNKFNTNHIAAKTDLLTENGIDASQPELPDTRPSSPAMNLEAMDGITLTNGNEVDDLPVMSPLTLPGAFGADTNNSTSPTHSDLDTIDFPLTVQFTMQ